MSWFHRVSRDFKAWTAWISLHFVKFQAPRVEEHLESLEFELNKEGPSFVEYAAEQRGYIVTVGYVI